MKWWRREKDDISTAMTRAVGILERESGGNLAGYRQLLILEHNGAMALATSVEVDATLMMLSRGMRSVFEENGIDAAGRREFLVELSQYLGLSPRLDG